MLKNNMKFDIRLLMPTDQWKRPVAPLNYIQWLFNTGGFKGKVIRFLEPKKISFEEFDKFTYIKYNNEPFVRYNIETDKVYIWLNNGTECKTIKDFAVYCIQKNIKILLEDAKNCTYGLK